MNNEICIELENTLVCHLRPHFLKVELDKDFIHIVVCHPKFTNLSVGERIGNVFSLLNTYNNDIINSVTVIIEVFSPDEINDLFEFWL